MNFANTEWIGIISLIKRSNVRYNLCIGCGKGTLIDTNNKRYLVTAKQKVADVQLIIDEILKTNLCATAVVQ